MSATIFHPPAAVPSAPVASGPPEYFPFTKLRILIGILVSYTAIFEKNL